VSKVDYPIYTEQEYRALMLAGFGPLLPFLNQATKLTDDVKIQASPLQEDESQAPIPPCKEGRKKRKEQQPPPPCTDEAIDEPSPRPSKRAKKTTKLPSPRATNEMMATRLLERSHNAPEPSEPALWCQCEDLPQGSPPCALHQDSPFWRWMEDQDQVPDVGSDDGIMVPKRSRDSKRTVLNYIRWRSRAWMPSFFYGEHARMEMARCSRRSILAD
jgi:hypothetical protein